ncbi:UvrD-helicase domain-containing protein [Providencia sp. PROV205]|uniref:UvrD-helicase domain-containing protein n=1 Tax=Providencia sp. PROV205 TaxID=2949903 RepID=UPI00234A1D33|nr:UvrD-helicase domain-containing protein [Providencia sp. PROV205]
MIKFSFTNEEIQSACKELGLPENTFDDKTSERRKIIDCWDNANIIACPGSGKTTVLLVKLLLLSQRMPFDDGSGICVLTHTNVAIDEIKNRLGNKADILFKYPNFFGTIQSFVGQFLLKKSLWDYYRSPITSVDTVVFNRKLIKEFKKLNNYKSRLHSLLFHSAYNPKITKKDIAAYCFADDSLSDKDKSFRAGQLFEALKKQKTLKKSGELEYSKCKSLVAENLPAEFNKQLLLKELIDSKHKLAMGELTNKKCESLVTDLNLDLIKNNIYNRAKNRVVAGNNTESFKEFKLLKEDIYKQGIVSFEDAFSLSSITLNDCPEISPILSNRFGFLFADEMQDTQLHQMDIISSVFNEAVIKQYFGDPDQAIFNGFSDEKSAWRDNIVGFERLAISDSKRFGNEIAACINPFKQVLPSISGNTQKQSLQPTILLFDQPEQALGLFVKQIHNHKLLDNDWRSTSARFNLVGSVGKAPAEKDTKLTINSYVENYSKETTKRKTNFDNLVSYFQKRPEAEIKQLGTKVYYEIFVNALVATLNLIPNNQYSKSKLLAELKENRHEFLTAYNLFIFKCIQQIETDAILPTDVKTEFINLLTQYNYQIPQNIPFTSENQINSMDAFTQKNNVIMEDGIEIKVGTIHSIKGETHMATLLVENENYGASESSYFWGYSSGNDLFCPNNTYKRPKKSYTQLEQRLKTTYVAMSRPTHLLCVAVQKSKAGCLTCPPDKKVTCKWKVIPFLDDLS